jgi:hypothetical protein
MRGPSGRAASEAEPMKRTAVAIADTITSIALVAWVGGHAALGAFAARIAFRDLPRALAATTMTTVFRQFDAVIAVGLLLVGLALILRGWAERPLGLAFGGSLLLVALGAFELLYVHPQIEQLFRAGRTLEPAFASLHRLSERCGHLEVVLSCVVLAGQAFARRRA